MILILRSSSLGAGIFCRMSATKLKRRISNEVTLTQKKTMMIRTMRITKMMKKTRKKTRKTKRRTIVTY